MEERAFADVFGGAGVACAAGSEGEEDGVAEGEGLVLDGGADRADDARAFVACDGGVGEETAEEAALEEEVLTPGC